MCRSEPEMVVAVIRTSASFGCVMVGRGTSSYFEREGTGEREAGVGGGAVGEEETGGGGGGLSAL